MSDKQHVAVIGGGSWATALTKILCNNLQQVHWYMRNEDARKHISIYGKNPNYLSSVNFDASQLVLHNSLLSALQACEIIIIAVPCAFLDNMLKEIPKEKFEEKKIFSAVKGIIPEHNSIPARYYNKQLGIPYDDIGIICGPCHAEEVALEKLSYLTIACKNENLADRMAGNFSCRYIVANTSDDIFGTELSVVLKNIYALAAGICHGLRYGDNFQAVLMSNALQEMERFIDKVSPVHRDVKTSAYLGDLLVTSYSQYSRNRTLGTMIGKGYSVKSAMMEMDMVAEGFYAAKGIMEINKKFKVDVPIVETVYNILYEKASPRQEMKSLSDKFN